MNSFVNQRLSQRKSSLNQPQKAKTTRTTLDGDSFRIPLKNIDSNISQSYKVSDKNNQFQSFQSAHKKQQILNRKTQVSKTKREQSIDKQIYSSSKKSTKSRLRDEQSSDYIRNLYKKYLGKQNKQFQQNKSTIDMFTQRKLRTTESKQLYHQKTDSKDYSRLQNIKDSTKKALFRNQQKQDYTFSNNEPSNRAQKTKISSILKNQQELVHVYNIQSQRQELISQKQKINIQKNQKQRNVKNCESKKRQQKIQKFQQLAGKKSQLKSTSTLHNFSKLKQKQPKKVQSNNQNNEKLLRSNSTQIKRQSIQKNPSYQSKTKQKILTQVNESSKQNRQNLKKIKDNKIIPHRQSYCQFDTQKQLEQINLQSNKFKQSFSRKTHQKVQINRIRQIESQNIAIYDTFINNIEGLRMLVGQNNSIYKTLKRINNVKNRMNQQEYQY